MTNITEKEYRVLASLATNSYTPVNYGYPESFDECGAPWKDCINDSLEPSGMEGTALSGVCASLTKKGLVKSGADWIGMTEAGFDAWFYGRAARAKRAKKTCRPVTESTYPRTESVLEEYRLPGGGIDLQAILDDSADEDTQRAKRPLTIWA